MPLMKYFCDGLTPELVKKAEEELGETEVLKNECLAKIKSFINDEPDFYPCMEDIFLLRFLRVRKFNVEKAFKSLKEFYVYKAQYSGIISDLLPSDISNVWNHGECAISEYRNKDGAGLFICYTGHYDTKIFSPNGQITLFLQATEVGLEVEATQITGYSVILDFDDFNLTKARYFGHPINIYRIIKAILRSVPCRIKSYHIVNEPRFVNGMLNVGMYLVPKKLRERLYFHGGDLNDLHKFISPEILPEEYGGKQGPFKKWGKKFGEIMLNHEDHFKKIKEYGFKGKTFEKFRKW